MIIKEKMSGKILNNSQIKRRIEKQIDYIRKMILSKTMPESRISDWQDEIERLEKVLKTHESA